MNRFAACLLFCLLGITPAMAQSTGAVEDSTGLIVGQMPKATISSSGRLSASSVPQRHLPVVV